MSALHLVNGQLVDSLHSNNSKIGYGPHKSQVTVVLGSQWGDEGKGKVVDMLATTADIVCRFQGGNNASHMVVVNGQEFDFHLLPSGIVNEKCTVVLGNGVVIHLPGLFDEINKNIALGLQDFENRLIISNRAHLVFDFHQQVDSMQEIEKGQKSIGTTRRGIGPTYSSKTSRCGIRVGDLLVADFRVFEEKFSTVVATYRKLWPELHINIESELARYRVLAEKLRPFVRDTIQYLHWALQENKKIIVEGATGTMLDIDFGTYPFVTSSNCTIGGVLTGLGIPPQSVTDVIGVVKAYTTRVGHGPFPTEQRNPIGDLLQQQGGEFGIVTQRKRRCGWLDLPLLKYSTLLNGFTAFCLTKLDILDVLPEIRIAVGYLLNGKRIDYVPSSIFEWERIKVEYKIFPGWLTSIETIRKFSDLPINAQNYVRFIENELGIRIRWIGVGKDRYAVINNY